LRSGTSNIYTFLPAASGGAAAFNRSRHPQRPVRILLFFCLCLLLASCSRNRSGVVPAIRDIAITEDQTSPNFSLQQIDKNLLLVYPDLSSLSLNLVTVLLEGQQPDRLDLGETSYLDRISDTPEVEADFGLHLFFTGFAQQQILYVDREEEDRKVLKWLTKKSPEQSWWIDALPDLGRPIAGWDTEGKDLELFFLQERSLNLYRLSEEHDPQLIDGPIRFDGPLVPVGKVSTIHDGGFRAFTVYDSQSRRLYLVSRQGDGIRWEAIYPYGETHCSRVVDSRLLILVYEPPGSALTLLERPPKDRELAQEGAFTAVPVTLCKGTTSVFLAVYRERLYYLFNERSSEGTGAEGFSLSILYPYRTSKGWRYEKVRLVEGEAPIRAFRVHQIDDRLYIAYLRDSLRLLTFSLADLTAP
jgi:hypothetical protein